MTTKRFQSLSHWGAFTALVEDGRVVGCEPFAHDPAPSPMLEAIPQAMLESVNRAAELANSHRVDMACAKNEGLDNAEPRTSENTTPTSFRQWCAEVLKPAVFG